PRPEHVEYGNGARKPSQRRGYGRGRGNARPQQEHLGNRLPPEERMLPDDYGNRIDEPAPGNRRASSQRPERPQRGQRQQRSGRDAQGTGRSERGQRGRSDRQPRSSGDYMDEQPAPRFVD